MRFVFKEQLEIFEAFLQNFGAISCTKFEKDGHVVRVSWTLGGVLHWLICQGDAYEYVTENDAATELWQRWQHLIVELEKARQNGDFEEPGN